MNAGFQNNRLLDDFEKKKSLPKSAKKLQKLQQNKYLLFPPAAFDGEAWEYQCERIYNLQRKING